ncbi:MAG: hypothetical protein JO051_03685 [Acidobacteriaceae bacterium]|nr:hypothetical protein [Acidobacteriaceae bacterium]
MQILQLNKVVGSTMLLASACVFHAHVAKADLITNGSFEAVQITTAYSSNPADIPGWTHTGSAGDALLWRAGPQCCGGTNTAKAGDGSQFVTMGGGFGPSGSAAWSQTVNGLTVGQSYTVSFLIAAEGETPTQQVTVGLTSGSSTAPETFTTLATNTLFWQNWGTDVYMFSATSTTGVLQFSVTNQPYDVGLDGVSIAPTSTAVPEPRLSLLTAVLLAGAVLLFARTRLTRSCPRP